MFPPAVRRVASLEYRAGRFAEAHGMDVWQSDDGHTLPGFAHHAVTFS
jgi:hypothetical protein